MSRTPCSRPRGTFCAKFSLANSPQISLFMVSSLENCATSPATCSSSCLLVWPGLSPFTVSEVLAQQELLLAELLDLGVQVEGDVAGVMQVGRLVGLGDRPLQRADGAFGVGAVEIGGRLVAVLLGLAEAVHGMPYAAQPHLQLLRGFALRD